MPASPIASPITASNELSPASRPALWLQLACCLLLLLGVGLGLAHMQLPAASQQPVPPEAFSAQRAMQPLQQIAQAPRTPGSAEHARVRAYLLQQLQALGLQVEVQSGIGRADWGLGQVHNIVARLPGSRGSGQAILLMAHYDSVSNSPGAGDDGAALAAILETLRALRHSPPLANDVMVLLTDGEELGSLGAQLFITSHPQRDKVGVVLNFEYRGNSGPAWMFETSRGNGKLIAALQQASPSPYANSLLYEVYKRMPNYTDFTLFKRMGIPGLNFAAGEGHVVYHSPLDNIQRLDTASLQHVGENMLALTRHLGQMDLQNMYADDVVYTNFPGLGLLNYAASYLPLLAVLGLFVACALVLRRRAQWRWPYLMLALMCHLLHCLLLTLAAAGLWRAVLWLHPNYLLHLHGSLYHQAWYLAAFPLLACALSVVWQKFCWRYLSQAEAMLGASLLWCLLLLACQVYLPGVSFLFLLPLLPVLVCHLLLLLIRPAAHWQLLAWSLALLPGIMLFTPLLRLLLLALTMQQAFVAIAVLALFLSLMSAWLGWQQLAVATRTVKSIAANLPLVLSLPTGLICLLGGSLYAGYDAQQPRPSHLAYLYDANEERAWWYSRDQEPDHWSRGFFASNARLRHLPQITPAKDKTFWVSPAPGKLPAPRISLLSDRIVQQRRGQIRVVELEIASMRGAQHMRLGLRGGRAYAVQVFGHRMSEDLHSPWYYDLTGLADQSVHVLLEMEVGSKMSVLLLDSSPGLPATGWPPRPPDLMQSAARDSDASLAFSELQL